MYNSAFSFVSQNNACHLVLDVVLFTRVNKTLSRVITRKDGLPLMIEKSLNVLPASQIAEKTSPSKEDHARFLRNIADTMAKESLRAYNTQWGAFCAWADRVGRESFPASPSTVAAYLDELEANGKRVATIAQAVAAISKAHKIRGAASPCASEEVRAARKAAARRAADRGEGAPRPKAAATSEVIRTLVNSIEGDSLLDLRDRALILCGFYGAFRRSELAALRLSDLREEKGEDGRPVIVVTVRKSKTDQTGEGMDKAIFPAAGKSKKYCPVAALRAWIAAAGLSGNDPLFPRIRKGGHIGADCMGGDSVALVLKKRAAAAGVELDISGHSLRRGFVTSAVTAGASERSIMNQTGHKSVLTLRRYIERLNAISDNAAAKIRL